MGLDTKTYWLTDLQSQSDFDFEIFSVSGGVECVWWLQAVILCYRPASFNSSRSPVYNVRLQ
jgi:hypothetical protein